MRDIGHFIGGQEVKGKSGRAGDVFNPNTGEVQAKVALASHSEVAQAIANAQAAQPAWAATNPQRRARVMFKFLELVQAEYDDLARLLSSEHGKTFVDSKGDIQRGLEVAEFACGIPHLMKGEYTEGAGPGIDIYSLRQPLGVVAGITPFNFPAMIPMWKFAPAIACGNAPNTSANPPVFENGSASDPMISTERGGGGETRGTRERRGGMTGPSFYPLQFDP